MLSSKVPCTNLPVLQIQQDIGYTWKNTVMHPYFRVILKTDVEQKASEMNSSRFGFYKMTWMTINVFLQPIGICRGFFFNHSKPLPRCVCWRFRMDLESDRWLWLLQNRKKPQNKTLKLLRVRLIAVLYTQANAFSAVIHEVLHLAFFPHFRTQVLTRNATSF